MISDRLSDAIDSIDGYLNDPLYEDVYAGELRARIITCRDQMEALRIELDARDLHTNGQA